MLAWIRIAGFAAAGVVAACAAVEQPPAPPTAPAHEMTGPTTDVVLPDWAERMPTEADFRNVYPVRALDAEIEGVVRLSCIVLEDRHVDCSVASEPSPGVGFGPAAMRLAPLFVIREGHPAAVTGGQVVIPVRFALAY